MGIQFKQLSDGSVGLEGVAGGDGEFISIQAPFTAALASGTLFTCTRPMVVKGIVGRLDVSGTGGACTFDIRKVASGTAGASGTLLHSGTFNVAGAANTNQTLTLVTTTGVTTLAAGQSIFLTLTGLPTSAVGCISIIMTPA